MSLNERMTVAVVETAAHLFLSCFLFSGGLGFLFFMPCKLVAILLIDLKYIDNHVYFPPCVE